MTPVLGLISPEVHRLLVVDRGWPPAAYQRWLADTLVATIAPRD